MRFIRRRNQMSGRVSSVACTAVEKVPTQYASSARFSTGARHWEEGLARDLTAGSPKVAGERAERVVFSEMTCACQHSWSSRCTAQSSRAGPGLNARRMMSGGSR